MVKVLLLTDVNYWQGGAGHRSRISAFIKYLKKNCDLTVLYIGSFESQCDSIGFCCDYKFNSIDGKQSELEVNIGAFLDGKQFDAVLVEYIELSFVLDFFDSRTILILDTHDLVAPRIKSFADLGLEYNGLHLTASEEFAIMSKYDYILLIQEHDLELVSEVIGREKLILVPHSVDFKKQTVKRVVKHIGFLASEYSPNIQGLTWFVNDVWPEFKSSKLVLNVYGNICEVVPSEVLSVKNIVWHSFVEDLEIVYKQCDIMINPVKCGAGLKIKNLEALGNGIPLVTTRHAAIGLDDHLESNFLLGDSADEFKSKIYSLVNDYNKRKLLANSGYEYVQEYFSAEKCYSELLARISSKMNFL